jgi:hypothetical protein
MTSDIKQGIIERLEDTAEWRDEKAKKFPDDERNILAAEELRALCTSIQVIPDDDPIFAELDLEGDQAEDSYSLSERFQERLREIGFHTGYDGDGRKFLGDLLMDYLEYTEPTRG